MPEEQHRSPTVSVAPCATYDDSFVAEAIASAFHPFGGAASIVAPGDAVLVKPNLLSPRDPAQAVTTHPAVVEQIVNKCFEAGASRVYIGDSCAGGHNEERLWDATGMRDAVERAGGTLISFRGQMEQYTCGEYQVPIPAWLKEIDTFISVPKLKTHSLTGITCALKNSYGLVCGQTKSFQHANHPSPEEMSDFLIDIFSIRPPDFVLVDAVTVMQGAGPANGKRAVLGVIVGGIDAVAVDTVCAEAYNLDWASTPILRAARNRNTGAWQRAKIAVQGDGCQRLESASFSRSHTAMLDRVPRSFYRLLRKFLGLRPVINHNVCRRCDACARFCSQNAIVYDEANETYKVYRQRCILCFCCTEACPYEAIKVRSRFHVFRR